ncbi:MAG TPA: TerC family protein [Candidatus Tectomicrobia bacterium]|nr:TerC family protein [Candidatus Tectomicrobia bacterium]
MDAYPVPLWAWVGFLAFVVAMLAVDLGIFHRTAHRVTIREAAVWSAVWVSLAGAFAVLVAATMGGTKGVEFVTGYVVEWSLSVDNLFVFLVIFQYFAVPADARHRVLFYGILGAILMRGAFIAGGIALLTLFHWIIYVFGAFLILTGAKLAFQSEESVQVEKNPVLRLAQRVLPVTRAYEGHAFLVRRAAGSWAVTPLFLVLLVVESTDVVFAVDSVPAILAITRDPFIVYTSNIFAILGLRALFFLIAGVIDYFRYLRYGLSAVLVFVGIKMVASEVYKVHPAVSLAVIVTLLGASIVASLVAVRAEAHAEAARGEKREPAEG